MTRKIKASLLALVVITAVLFSSLFVITQAQHKCNDVDCQICTTINACMKQFKNTVNDGEQVGAFIFALGFIAMIVVSKKDCDNVKTLVDLKVKLSN